jgi:disulfide bond formation protein DsbB
MQHDSQTLPERGEHPIWCLWLKFELAIQHLCVLGICGVLLGAFWIQFGAGEYPCPLCLLQRMAMIMTAIGSIFIITHGHYARIQRFSVIGLGYGMSVLAALVGMLISARQVLLHIEPGDPGYGSPMLGLHLYTWALIVFLTVILVSGIMLIFGRDPQFHQQRCSDPEMNGDPLHMSSRLPWYSLCTFWIFGAIILVNAFSAFAEAGFSVFLPDNPTSYLLFESGTSR